MDFAVVELPQLNNQPPHNETEIGSYFIANYPPFSVWSAQQIPQAIDALSKPASPTTLGLYLHIPFCRKRCKFCYFRVYTDKNASDVDVYIDSLAREIALYADRPGLKGRQFDFVYFGGGTPSFLSSQQLERLIERIREHWSWESAREVTFECEPGTLQQHKVETIKQIGVTRLSLGVEHFDDDILEINGRAHKSKEIFRAYEWIRDVGFPQVNIDLIAGMVGETDEKWQATVVKALEMAPDSVTIYQMEMPHNTVISRESKQTGQPVPIADWSTKRRWVKHAFDHFLAAGYQISSGYTLVKPNGKGSSFEYRDALWHGADLIGTGVASFSHFQGVHYQNVDQWEDYVARTQAGELPLSRALVLTPEQKLIREMILQMKTGKLEVDYFRGKFGTDIRSSFADGFTSLVAEGSAYLENGSIRLTPQGLLRVDTLLPRFFEKQYRDVRYT